MQVKDQVRFSSKFGDLVGNVTQIQGKEVKISLTIPGFGRYTFTRDIKQLKIVDGWIY